MAGKYLRLWRIAGAILFVISAAAALCAALVLPYTMARWWTNIPLLAFISIASFFLVFWVGSRICARLWQATTGARFAARAATASTLAFAISLILADPEAD